jgi:hypothetical protein
MANRYIKSPYDVVAVGDVVTVWVLSVDAGRRRVSLTMIKPGTERKPPERRPPQQQGQRPEQRPDRPPQGRRPQRGQRPPQGRRPEPAAAAAPAGETATAAPPPRRPAPPPQRPRKPHRSVPLPKLSQDALKGAVPLRTFGELEAFFKSPRADEPAAETPPAEPAPAETPVEAEANPTPQGS